MMAIGDYSLHTNWTLACDMLFALHTCSRLSISTTHENIGECNVDSPATENTRLGIKWYFSTIILREYSVVWSTYRLTEIEKIIG